MSEIPETPTQAARALIGWFVGAMAFQSFDKLASGSYGSFAGYGVAAVVVAIMDYKLKSLLARSPRLTATLNSMASDARWWGTIAIMTLLMGSLSPYVEQYRLPFVWWWAKPTFISATNPAITLSPIPQEDYSLKTAFHDDFPGTLATSVTMTFPFGSTEIQVELTDFRDPHDGAEYLGSYIAATPEQTREIVEYILKNHKNLMAEITKNSAAVAIQSSGEYGGRSTATTKFTGRVFIYDATSLQYEDLLKLKPIADEQGLTVIYRDHTYLMSRPMAPAQPKP